MSQVRQALLDRPEIGERRRLDDGDAGLRMIEPVFQGLRAEQMRERQRERPHLEDRHVGDRGLGALRQDEGHALAAPDAESRERVRQAVCRRLDVPERVGGGGARLVLPIEREARGARVRLRSAWPGTHRGAHGSADGRISHALAVPGRAGCDRTIRRQESDPDQRVARHDRAAGRALGTEVRRGAQRRQAEDLQARARGVRAGAEETENPQRENRLRVVELLGRARRQVLRLHGLLDQPARGACRAPRLHPRQDHQQPPGPGVKFCSNCAAPVMKRVPPGDTLPRWVCEHCGEIHYENPKLVIGCVPEFEGRILLCRRAIEPRYGYWTLPAGFMENDETASQAALRETLEEAGASIELGAPFSMLSVPRANQVDLFYLGRLLDLGFRPGEETLEVTLFDEERIPWKELAFRTVAYTLKRWFEDRSRGNYQFHAADLQ